MLFSHTHIRFVENANKPAPEFVDDPKVDYSMKEGEKITINLKVKTKGQTKSTPTRGGNAAFLSGGSDDNGGGLLLPPPQSGAPLKQPQQARTRGTVPQQVSSPVGGFASAANKGGMDDFDFLSKPAAPQQQQQAQQQQQKVQAPASALDDFLQ